MEPLACCSLLASFLLRALWNGWQHRLQSRGRFSWKTGSTFCPQMKTFSGGRWVKKESGSSKESTIAQIHQMTLLMKIQVKEQHDRQNSNRWEHKEQCLYVTSLFCCDYLATEIKEVTFTYCWSSSVKSEKRLVPFMIPMNVDKNTLGLWSIVYKVTANFLGNNISNKS